MENQRKKIQVTIEIESDYDADEVIEELSQFAHNMWLDDVTITRDL